MKLKNLRYEMMGKEPVGHPQKVMRDLGIQYIHSRPAPIGSCWLFFGCSNVPEPLPKYLEEIPSHTINELAKPLDLNKPPRQEIHLKPGDRVFINEKEITDFDRIDALIDIVENGDDDGTPDVSPKDAEADDNWIGGGGEADGGGASGDWSDDD